MATACLPLRRDIAPARRYGLRDAWWYICRVATRAYWWRYAPRESCQRKICRSAPALFSAAMLNIDAALMLPALFRCWFSPFSLRFHAFMPFRYSLLLMPLLFFFLLRWCHYAFAYWASIIDLLMRWWHWCRWWLILLRLRHLFSSHWLRHFSIYAFFSLPVFAIADAAAFDYCWLLMPLSDAIDYWLMPFIADVADITPIFSIISLPLFIFCHYRFSMPLLIRHMLTLMLAMRCWCLMPPLPCHLLFSFWCADAADIDIFWHYFWCRHYLIIITPLCRHFRRFYYYWLVSFSLFIDAIFIDKYFASLIRLSLTLSITYFILVIFIISFPLLMPFWCHAVDIWYADAMLYYAAATCLLLMP